MSAKSSFAPVTDAILARARHDRVFRQQLLTQNLDFLLGKLQELRAARRSGRAGADQMREGALLAVKLAELIQAGGGSPTAP